MGHASRRIWSLLFAIAGVTALGVAGAGYGPRSQPHDIQSASDSGLVLYYPFNGSAEDASGNGHHGTVVAATLTSDRFGNPNSAFSFNGSSSYIYVASTADLNPSPTMTYAAWFRATVANQIGNIIAKGNDQQPGFFVARLHPSPTNMGFAVIFKEDQGTSTLTSVNASDVSIVSNQWYFLTVTYDGTTLRSYINGELRNVVSANKTLGSNNGPFTVGRHPLAGFYYYFNGKIDDVRLYNRALSSNDVADLYMKGSLQVTLYDAENWGQPGASARVELFSPGGSKIAEAPAGVNSQVLFSGISQGSGYFYRVHVDRPTPWGEQFWGEKTGISILGGHLTSDIHTHNTAYMPDVKVFVDSTNEELQPGNRRTIRPGTRVRIETLVKDPSYDGALPVTAYVGICLDRDKLPPFDAQIFSPSQSLTPGTTKTATTEWVAPALEGDYYFSLAAFAWSSRYDTSITDASGWHEPAFRIQKDSVASPPWKTVNTGNSHTVIIPMVCNPMILGVPLQAGDYIGVFYDSAGVPKCAGFDTWSGSTNISVAAFGDDPTTSAKDGLAAGEAFNWKIFRASDGRIFDAEATYVPVGGLITNTDLYSSNGISQLASLNGGVSTHCLSLRAGWSLIASYVAPLKPSMDSVFQSVNDDVVIVKNGNQKTYIPSIPVNGIGSWTSSEGYQIKLTHARSLCIQGQRLFAGSAPISLPLGWSLLPFIGDEDISIASGLSSIEGNIIIVKDQDGKTYAPSIGVNTIGNLRTGQGYQIKMSSARTLHFPSLDYERLMQASLSEINLKRVTSDPPPWYRANTGINHTVVIPSSTTPTFEGVPLAVGDFIGAFYDSAGKSACAGYEEWLGTGPMAIAIFGDDPTTAPKDGFLSGESLQWKIWRRTAMQAYQANTSYMAPGGLGGLVTDSSRFTANGISAIASLAGTLTSVGLVAVPVEFSLLQNFPNPFNPTTTITFGIPDRMDISISLFNLLGEHIADLANGTFDAGYHSVTFTADRLSSGTYFYRLRSNTSVLTKRMLLMR